MRRSSQHGSLIKFIIGTALFFLLFSVGVLEIPKQTKNFFDDKLKNGYLSLTTEQIIGIFRTEIPVLLSGVQAVDSTQTFSSPISGWVNLFSVNTFNLPNQWIKEEIPVLSVLSNNNETFESDLTAYHDLPMESLPPDDFFQAEKNKTLEDNQQLGQEDEVKFTTGNKKVVFIYHTHNRESFLPEIQVSKINEAYHPKINITLAGKKLGQELERLGIGSVVSTKDYWPELELYSMSYKYSLQTVVTALKENKDFKYIFDIHRDSMPKEMTTRKINGKDYAAIYFIIGEGNENYQLNKEFAQNINNSLEKLYPGLSRGIYEKKKTSGTNGEYNQSVSPYSLTVEIGGVYNTLEEEYRSTAALAEAIADVYWDAEQVNLGLN